MRKLVDAALVLLLVVAGFWAYQNHNELLDWYYLRNYQPPARIAELAREATLTEQGQRLFYRAQPQIDADRQQLDSHCHIPNDRTIELGCYLSTDKIYLLEIQQPELADEMTVTAAHETLHAAYDRLSSSERNQVNSELEKVAARLTDKDLKDRLREYEQTEPGARDDELHSILGTEYANLTPTLESHYAKYFSQRNSLVALSERFKATFDDLRGEITTLDSSIKSLRSQMNSLRAERRIAEYNRLVPVINRQITQYNQKVELYNRYAADLLGRENTTQEE